MKKEKILLLNPLVGDDYEFTRVNRPLPMGLLGLASTLKDEFEIRLLDQRMDPDFDSLLKEELAKKPLFIGIHVMGGPQIRMATALSQLIRKSAGAPLVWGGAFPTMMPDVVLASGYADFVVRGEGEIPVLAFAKALRDRTPLTDVPSLNWRAGEKIEETALAPMPDMNQLPDLPYHLIDVARYDWSAGCNQALPGLKLQMESSRGCSSRCIFCYNPFFYQKSWRALTAVKTVDRMAALIRLGAAHIDIIDDSFFEDLDRVGEFAREILARKLGVSYLLNGGKVGPILKMRDEDLENMRLGGCRTIHLGAESGSDEVLQNIAKGITREEILASNVKLRRHGIQPSYYFIFGSPGETREDMRQSISAMMRILDENPLAKIVAAFSFTPFARTPGFRLAEAHGMAEPRNLDEWSRLDTLNTVQPWLDERTKRHVRTLFFLGMFIDDKIADLSPSPLIRFLARCYRPVARFRMKRFRLDWVLEEKIGRWALRWIQKRGLAQYRAAASPDS